MSICYICTLANVGNPKGQHCGNCDCCKRKGASRAIPEQPASGAPGSGPG